MNSKEDAGYRLNLARGFLKEAEQDYDLGRWRSCVDSSQMAVENFGKMVISIFKPVEKTHDPSLQLKELLDVIDAKIKGKLEEIIPLFGELGVEAHFMTDYGDEKDHKLPWDIYTEENAKGALDAARKIASSVEEIYNFYFQD